MIKKAMRQARTAEISGHHDLLAAFQGITQPTEDHFRRVRALKENRKAPPRILFSRILLPCRRSSSRIILGGCPGTDAYANDGLAIPAGFACPALAGFLDVIQHQVRERCRK
jgi:hypothetical protein